MNIVENAKLAAQATSQAVMSRLVPLAPDSWIPGGVPDPLIAHKHGLIGTSVSRLDGQLKVKGAARFAAEVSLDRMVYAALAYGTIPRGRIATLDTTAAEASAGVVVVMTHRNAPRMNKPAVFGSSPTAAGPQRPVDHAGRHHPLERSTDRGGPGRHAGAGRPCHVADPRHLRAGAVDHDAGLRQGGRRAAGTVHGPAALERDRRRRGGIGESAAPGRQHVFDPTSQP